MRAAKTTGRAALRDAQERLRAAGVPEPEADAWLLYEAAFGVTRASFLASRDEEVPEEGLARLSAMISRRETREPVQYILGHREFCGLDISVRPGVLIPRQDTETLVLTALETEKGTRGLDLCCGSGCIAAALSVLGGCRMTACDLSEEALSVARENFEKLAPETEVRRGDLWEAVPGEVFDFIVSNPPYIVRGEIAGLDPEVRENEPAAALDGGEDGLDFYRRIACGAPDHLKAGGRLYLEIGCSQAESVTALLKDRGFRDVRIVRDLAGKDRVAAAIWGEDDV